MMVFLNERSLNITWIINPPDFETLGRVIPDWCFQTLGRIHAVDNYKGYRDGIHESTTSLRFLGIVVRFLKRDVSSFVFAFPQNDNHSQT
jgi:hypothetical protein